MYPSKRKTEHGNDAKSHQLIPQIELGICLIGHVRFGHLRSSANREQLLLDGQTEFIRSLFPTAAVVLWRSYE